MANYTAEDVKKLREATAAGMLDCKKALDEAEGDYNKALDLIRVKGLKARSANVKEVAKSDAPAAVAAGEPLADWEKEILDAPAVTDAPTTPEA